ncbi:ABC transporter permease [Brevibacterium samyangense]|uniref:ABC transporter permease n=1 Tax=Brevibacterium samyangense TaxID=366888 RepID=A0ABN2TLA8_9MICO
MLSRLAIMIPIVLGVATISFLLMQASPGDPAASYLGDKATPESVEQLRRAWGLDAPVWQQYLTFIGGLFVGDLGNSFLFQVPVAQLLALRIPATLMLMVVSIVLAVTISVPIALWVTISKSPAASAVSRMFSATFQGMPAFFIGALLIAFVALRTGWFPVGGYGETFGEHLHSLLLPGLAVALNICPVLIRSLTAALGEALDAEYMNFALSKGLSRRASIASYAFRNAGISGISILGIQVGNLVGGALVIENVFAIPGLGSLLLQAVLGRDYPTVQALTVVFGILVVATYLVTDLVYGLVDPRVRLGKK